MEKVILKKGKMIGYFPLQESSSFYESQTFGQALEFAQRHHRQCLLKEHQGRITLTIDKVDHIQHAYHLVSELLNRHPLSETP